MVIIRATLRIGGLFPPSIYHLTWTDPCPGGTRMSFWALRACGKRLRTLAPATISSLWQIVVFQDGGWLGPRFGPATGVGNDEFLVVAMVSLLKPGNCGLKANQWQLMSVTMLCSQIFCVIDRNRSCCDWLANHQQWFVHANHSFLLNIFPDPSAINQWGISSLFGSTQH